MLNHNSGAGQLNPQPQGIPVEQIIDQIIGKLMQEVSGAVHQYLQLGLAQVQSDEHLSMEDLPELIEADVRTELQELFTLEKDNLVRQVPEQAKIEVSAHMSAILKDVLEPALESHLKKLHKRIDKVTCY